MHAKLEYNLCQGSETRLALYKDREAAAEPIHAPLLTFVLTNAQLTELVIVAGIKPVDLNPNRRQIIGTRANRSMTQPWASDVVLPIEELDHLILLCDTAGPWDEGWGQQLKLALTHYRKFRGNPSEVDRLRDDQCRAVMPLIGPLLDAWDGVPNDSMDDLDDLNAALTKIHEAMNGG